MAVRPLRRALLVAVATGAAAAALTGGVAPAAQADRPEIQGPVAPEGSFIGPVTAGQSALHSPRAVQPSGRKFK